MQKLFVFLFLSLMAQFVFASQDVIVKFDFDYQESQTGGVVNESKLHNEITIPNNNQWLMIGGLNGNLILLSKTESADTEKATIKFLVLDLGSQANFIRELTLTAKYDQKAILKLSDNNRKVQIDAVVSRPEATYG
jgi:hypothetical protein